MRAEFRSNNRTFRVEFDPPQKGKPGTFGIWRISQGELVPEDLHHLPTLMNLWQTERVTQVANATRIYFKEKRKGDRSEGELRALYNKYVFATDGQALALEAYQSYLFQNTAWKVN